MIHLLSPPQLITDALDNIDKRVLLIAGQNDIFGIIVLMQGKGMSDFVFEKEPDIQAFFGL
jgi:hypothetical protein